MPEMRSVPTGAGMKTMTRAQLQTFRVAFRAKLDELETEFLSLMPARLTAGMSPRERQLFMRGLVRRVTYGWED